MTDVTDAELAELRMLLGLDSELFRVDRLAEFSDAALLHFYETLRDPRIVTNVPSFVALRQEIERRGIATPDAQN